MPPTACDDMRDQSPKRRGDETFADAKDRCRAEERPHRSGPCEQGRGEGRLGRKPQRVAREHDTAGTQPVGDDAAQPARSPRRGTPAADRFYEASGRCGSADDEQGTVHTSRSSVMVTRTGLGPNRSNAGAANALRAGQHPARAEPRSADGDLRSACEPARAGVLAPALRDHGSCRTDPVIEH